MPMDRNSLLPKARPASRRPLQGAFRSTAGRQRLLDLCAVLLFLLLLPYACSLLFGKGDVGEETLAVPRDESSIMVACDTGIGVSRLPLETYVEGALAASIPADCEEETLKAQAIILRTLCMRAYENRQSIDDNTVYARDIGQEYLDMRSREALWEDSYEEKQAKIASAAAQTKGMYMTWEGQIIEPAYFWLSAGKTRNGKEVFGEGYDYLTSVDCSHDIEASGYSSTVTLKEKDFWAAMGVDGSEKITLTRDSAGYVLWVEAAGIHMSGEKFRSLFSLQSACFTISENGGNVTLESKGVGHGLGFCQFEANRRAVQGEDFLALLHVFFEGVEIQKTE
ncbi:hypothetical protein BEI59_17320 [Eisenbergiella tayi]|uniref:Sporulation stage II protein D amidase enhancer LytB N-terminal domain-containing protein n=2 Tax=Eisenbergiella tayi TaxID=1432052 RepID=A0A1E3UG34_9FIRM|nr:hypothetical protein BEI62_21975 [Eisenbergiella tayi]ODR49696.1 hypothetical protein BEI59_17320 [Eisenbergiella tayi]ODR50463.1 hypothetical protein BEI64_27820 [Eisenbergiella tayi]ODR60425.1 hypothetical protein BEI63_04395 [Eisenbergiella tayi]